MAGVRDSLEFGEGDGWYLRWMKEREKSGAELARREGGELRAPAQGGRRGEGDG